MGLSQSVSPTHGAVAISVAGSTLLIVETCHVFCDTHLYFALFLYLQEISRRHLICSFRSVSALRIQLSPSYVSSTRTRSSNNFVLVAVEMLLDSNIRFNLATPTSPIRALDFFVNASNYSKELTPYNSSPIILILLTYPCSSQCSLPYHARPLFLLLLLAPGVRLRN